MLTIAHSRTARSLRPLIAVAVAVLAPISACQARGEASRGAPDLPPELEVVRAGLDKYRDPIVAVHDGYLSSLACLEFPEPFAEGEMRYSAGGMGVHFLNAQHIGPTLDPARPQVLIYVPEQGKLRLVAAEWFMPAAAAGATPPSIFGTALAGPMEGHEPIMPGGLHHYDLHVWLWERNPAGIFSPTNPAVHCPAGEYTRAGGPPRMVHREGH